MLLQENNLEIFKRFLSDNDLKYTRQRKEIFSEFCLFDGHFTVYELYEKAKKWNRSIGIATVQRTLEILVKCNIARKIKIGNSIVKYEHNHFEHFHLNCKKCNKLIEVKSPRLLKLIKELAGDENFVLKNFSVSLTGICKECQKKML